MICLTYFCEFVQKKNKKKQKNKKKDRKENPLSLPFPDPFNSSLNRLDCSIYLGMRVFTEWLDVVKRYLFTIYGG